MLIFSSFVRLLPLLERAPANGTGTYSAVYPDDDSVRRILALGRELGLDGMQEAEKLHTTVLYSRRAVKADFDRVIGSHLPIEAVGDELQVFDHRSGGKKCLVLELSSLMLQGIHRELVTHHGGHHDFPSYRPHVTLAVDLPSDFKKPDLGRELSVPITFDRFTVEPIDRSAT